MKVFLLTLFLLVFSLSAWARPDYKYTFINAGVPYSKLTSQSETINDLDTAAGMSFSYGKRFGKRFAVELSYSQTSFKEDTQGDPLYPADFKSELQLTEIMVGYHIYLNSLWAIKMGYTNATLTRKFSETGLTTPVIDQITYNKNFSTFHVGVVANTRLFGNVGMFFEGIYSSSSAYNKISGTAGLQIRF